MYSADVRNSLKLLRDDAKARGMDDLAWVYGLAELAAALRALLESRRR